MNKYTLSLNAMQLSSIKVIIYVLLSITLLAAAYFFFYEDLMYYLFQLFLGWAYALRFLILFAAVFLSLFLCQYLEKVLFGTQLQMTCTDQYLALITGRRIYKIPYDQLKWFRLTKKNEVYSALEIQADRPLHFALGSWTSGLKDPMLEQFWNVLKKELKARGFEHNLNTAKEKQTIVVTEILCRDYSGYLNKQKKKRKWVFIFLPIYLVLILFTVFYLVPKFNNDGISINDGETIGSSYFEQYQNKIYFLKIGDGYFLVPDAKTQTFKALQTEGEIFTAVGADQEHVYWQDHQLPLLNPATSRYLGGDYTKDTQHVYFRDQLVKNADATTFQAIRHSQYNTPVYHFGKDKNAVFYKTIQLPGLETETARSFDNSSRYIRDRQHVFYKDVFLKGLNADQTKVYDSEHYRSSYATDGRHHYLDELSVATTASNKYFGSTAIDLNTFKLLIPSGEGSYLCLFGDARHLYFYDEHWKKMIMVYTFDQPVTLNAFGNGYFSDGQFTYTLNLHKIYTRSRSSSTTRGYEAEVLRVEKSNQRTEIASYAAALVPWKEKD